MVTSTIVIFGNMQSDVRLHEPHWRYFGWWYIFQWLIVVYCIKYTSYDNMNDFRMVDKNLKGLCRFYKFFICIVAGNIIAVKFLLFLLHVWHVRNDLYNRFRYWTYLKKEFWDYEMYYYTWSIRTIRKIKLLKYVFLIYNQ